MSGKSKHPGLFKKVENFISTNKVDNTSNFTVGSFIGFFKHSTGIKSFIRAKTMLDALTTLEKKGVIELVKGGKSGFTDEKLFKIQLKKDKIYKEKMLQESIEQPNTITQNNEYFDATASVLDPKALWELVNKIHLNPEKEVYVVLPEVPVIEAFLNLKKVLNGMTLDCCYNQVFNPRTKKILEDKKVLIVFKSDVEN